jgi:hypothetical protein
MGVKLGGEYLDLREREREINSLLGKMQGREGKGRDHLGDIGIDRRII